MDMPQIFPRVVSPAAFLESHSSLSSNLLLCVVRLSHKVLNVTLCGYLRAPRRFDFCPRVKIYTVTNILLHIILHHVSTIFMYLFMWCCLHCCFTFFLYYFFQNRHKMKWFPYKKCFYWERKQQPCCHLCVHTLRSCQADCRQVTAFHSSLRGTNAGLSAPCFYFHKRMQVCGFNPHLHLMVCTHTHTRQLLHHLFWKCSYEI